MIHHLSIAARDPKHVAGVLAEFMGGVAVPFPPNPGSFFALQLDEHGSGVEVYPAGTELRPGGSNGGSFVKKPEGGGDPVFDVEGFLQHNLNFTGREFDAVLLWTTLDYLPEPLVQPTVDRLRSCMRPGGKVLALFHNKQTGENTAYCRYHLSETDAIDMQGSAPIPLRRSFTNRNIEKTFERFANCKFFLAKDNLYEVIITR